MARPPKHVHQKNLAKYMHQRVHAAAMRGELRSMHIEMYAAITADMVLESQDRVAAITPFIRSRRRTP